MQENTEGFNENSNSEVIILPPNSHLEETLVSDDDETDNEAPHSYDAKLNAKLKELGLYEDGMTIQQKEELLAVVAVSFKTAEEEKTRRQWYEEYANAALSFPEDEIEFSFQHSPELELSTKESCYSGDYNTSSVKSEGSSVCEIDGSIASTSSGVTSGDGHCHMQNPNEFQHLLSNPQSTDFKTKSQPRKSRSRGISNKLALQEGNTVTSHSTVSVLDCQDTQLTNKQKKHLLEKSMSTWRPCLSPKDEPLICPSRQLPEESDESYSEAKCNQKMLEYVQDFNFALAEMKKSRKKMSHLARPYHLTRNGHCIKKVVKLDSLDIMVGVQEGREEVTGEASTSDCSSSKEPFSRTSGGAFRYAKLHRERIDNLRNSISSVNNHNSCITLQSGSSHDLKKITLSSPSEECRTPEIVIEEDLENTNISPPGRYNSSISHCNSSTEQLSYETRDTIILETKLPKFSNLRPDLCVNRILDKESLSRPNGPCYSGYSTINSVNSTPKSSVKALKKENHIDSSYKDGNVSDSSSVIDVETFDDEVEEIVLKRKILHEPTISDKQTYSSRPKRLKKSTS